MEEMEKSDTKIFDFRISIASMVSMEFHDSTFPPAKSLPSGSHGISLLQASMGGPLMVSGLEGALSTQQLVAQLLQASIVQALEPATDIALLNLQLNAGGNPEGVGELIDVVA